MEEVIKENTVKVATIVEKMTIKEEATVVEISMGEATRENMAKVVIIAEKMITKEEATGADSSSHMAVASINTVVEIRKFMARVGTITKNMMIAKEEAMAVASNSMVLETKVAMGEDSSSTEEETREVVMIAKVVAMVVASSTTAARHNMGEEISHKEATMVVVEALAEVTT
jgi:hypothetical protein